MNPRSGGHAWSTVWERAISCLVDYHCRLSEREARGTRERRGRHRRYRGVRGRQFARASTSGQRAIRFESSRRSRSAGDDPCELVTCASKAAVREAERWERERAHVWNRDGRLTADGRLRVSGNPWRWTLDSVGRAFPDLRGLDRLAVLILLDGWVEEGWMDAHTNIRAVIDEIVDIRVARIFGQVLTEIRSSGALSGDLTGEDTPVPSGRRRRAKRVRDPKTGKLIPREELARQSEGKPGEDDQA